MDWQGILSIVAIVLFVAFMLRGGGMGCCGVGSHSRGHGDEKDVPVPEKSPKGGRTA